MRKTLLRAAALTAAVLIVASGVLLAAFQKPILRSAGWALVAEDPVEPSDAIVVPEWSHAEGALEAADLFRSGIAARVAVIVDSPEPAHLELVRRNILAPNNGRWVTRLLRTLRVTSIEEIPISAAGTEAEAEVLLRWCEEHEVRSVVVVSASDHSRRLRRVLGRSVRNKGIRMTIRASRYSAFDPNRWFETRGGVRTEIIELEKLIFDILRHPIH